MSIFRKSKKDATIEYLLKENRDLRNLCSEKDSFFPRTDFRWIETWQ